MTDKHLPIWGKLRATFAENLSLLLKVRDISSGSSVCCLYKSIIYCGIFICCLALLGLFFIPNILSRFFCNSRIVSSCSCLGISVEYSGSWANACRHTHNIVNKQMCDRSNHTIIEFCNRIHVSCSSAWQVLVPGRGWKWAGDKRNVTIWSVVPPYKHLFMGVISISSDRYDPVGHMPCSARCSMHLVVKFSWKVSSKTVFRLN